MAGAGSGSVGARAAGTGTGAATIVWEGVASTGAGVALAAGSAGVISFGGGTAMLGGVIVGSSVGAAAAAGFVRARVSGVGMGAIAVGAIEVGATSLATNAWVGVGVSGVKSGRAPSKSTCANTDTQDATRSRRSVAGFDPAVKTTSFIGFGRVFLRTRIIYL